MLGIKRSQAGCRQVGSVQQAAFSNQQSAKPVYRKGPKDAKKEVLRFLFSFACFASVAVKLLLIADG
jgi:hypothetical protein